MSKILIVEDDMILAMVLSKNLEKLGHTVVDIQASGQGAIDAVSSKQPELIIMDIKLIGSIDGIQTMIEIRKFSEIPVIYLSANSDEYVRQQAQMTEGSEFVSKPIDSQELKGMIERALSKS